MGLRKTTPKSLRSPSFVFDNTNFGVIAGDVKEQLKNKPGTIIEESNMQVYQYQQVLLKLKRFDIVREATMTFNSERIGLSALIYYVTISDRTKEPITVRVEYEDVSAVLRQSDSADTVAQGIFDVARDKAYVASLDYTSRRLYDTAALLNQYDAIEDAMLVHNESGRPALKIKCYGRHSTMVTASHVTGMIGDRWLKNTDEEIANAVQHIVELRNAHDAQSRDQHLHYIAKAIVRYPGVAAAFASQDHGYAFKVKYGGEWYIIHPSDVSHSGGWAIGAIAQAIYTCVLDRAGRGVGHER